MKRAKCHVWTAKERELLRRHYGPHAPEPWPTERLVKAIGQPAERLWNAAVRFGCARPVDPVAASPDEVRRLLGEGLNDRQIAARLGAEHIHNGAQVVFRLRKKMGLPAIGHNAQTSELHRRRLRDICGRYEVPILEERKREVKRMACLLRGWPLAENAHQCDVLDALADRGPLEWAPLCEALGIGPGKSGAWPHIRLTRALGALRLDGLVARTWRGVKGASGGGRRMVCYHLAPGVVRGPTTHNLDEEGNARETARP